MSYPYYCEVHDVLSREQIEAIKAPYTDEWLVPAEVTTNNESYEDSARKTKVGSIRPNHWVHEMVMDAILLANDEYFHYDLVDFVGPLQYAKYNEGDYFTWHTDGDQYMSDNVRYRKLSISVLLSDPKDYEGGELEIYDNAQRNEISFKPKAGDAIVFPSWVEHRVAPITDGERISIVGWCGGPLFR